MSRMTFCPNCKHFAEVDQYGFITCSHCGKYFIAKKKKEVDNK